MIQDHWALYCSFRNTNGGYSLFEWQTIKCDGIKNIRVNDFIGSRKIISLHK